MDIKKCPVCGRAFHAKRKSKTFCSEGCKKKFAYVNSKDYSARKCIRCGRPFIPIRLNQFYCCKECQNKQSIDICHDNTRFGGNKELVLKRDGYKCVMCGNVNGINVHHKDESGNSEYPNNEPDNLITLCDACHIKTHNVHRKRTRKRINVTCQNCGKPFETTEEAVSEGRGKYCSKECKHASMSQPKTSFAANCLVCGKEFPTTPYKQSIGKGKYCSPECSQQAQTGVHKYKPITKQIPTTCLTCGKIFMTTQYYLDSGRDKYCCRACSTIARRGKPPHRKKQ
jgi:hypothetical protein